MPNAGPLRALRALVTDAPEALRPSLVEATEALATSLATATAEAQHLANAQAEALVHSAMLMSELETAREELRLAAAEAEAANRAKSAFVADMSHELRTPLHAILGYGELLSEEATDRGVDWVSTDAGRICTAGRHLLALINDLLDISKIESGKVDLEIRSVPLGGLLQAMHHDFTMLAAKKGITFTLHAPGDAGTMTTDPTRLRQVLTNLLGNACKFTNEGGVTLAVRDLGLVVEFEIRDTGIGIPATQLPHLFQRFHQANSSTTRLYGGTGLGLHLSRQLCELLGGGVTVSSTVGVGTTMIVTLPRVAPTRTAGIHAPQPGAARQTPAA